MVIERAVMDMSISMAHDGLTFHGKTREMCEWVLSRYGNRPEYKNNKSIQVWLKESKAFLDALEEDERFDQAVESKFGQS